MMPAFFNVFANLGQFTSVRPMEYCRERKNEGVVDYDGKPLQL